MLEKEDLLCASPAERKGLKQNAVVDQDVIFRDYRQKEQEPDGAGFSMGAIFSYIMSDLKKKPRSYKIGMFTVGLVVTFVVFMWSVVEGTPLIFLKLSQDQVGEADIVVRASGANNLSVSGNVYEGAVNPWNSPRDKSKEAEGIPLINETKIDSETYLVSELEGMGPRWLFIGKLRKPDEPTLNVSSVVLLIDSKKELDIGLGRAFLQVELRKDEAFVTGPTLRYMGITPGVGEEIELHIDLVDLFSNFNSNITDSESLTVDNLRSVLEDLGIGTEGSISVPLDSLASSIGDSLGSTVAGDLFDALADDALDGT